MSVLSSTLPADLPTNWSNNQIVAPDGTAVGLTQQHGYNYLMQQVNAAQSAINQIDAALAGGIAKIQSGTYVGTGTFGIDNPNTITCDFAPKILFCGKNQACLTNYNFTVSGDIDRTYRAYGFLLTSMLTTEYKLGYGFLEAGGVASSSSISIFARTSTDGKTIYWYGAGTAGQNNMSGTTYYWLAIG